MNNYTKHLLILSEDNIYKEFALGFFFNVPMCNIHIGETAGGWKKLIDLFKEQYESSVRKYQFRHVLLLLDLDGNPERLKEICDEIPSDIKERVFILSCKNEAEDLKRNLGGGKTEKVGKVLAESCSNNTYTTPENPWLCGELKHNGTELSRLADLVYPWF